MGTRFFDLVAEHGVAEVARALSRSDRYVRMLVRGDRPLTIQIIRCCVAAYGDAFDSTSHLAELLRNKPEAAA